MKNTKILIFNTTFGVGGGAETIATYLFKELPNHGYGTNMIVGEKRKENEKVEQIPKSRLDKILSSRNITLERLLRKVTGFNDTFFLWPYSLPFRKVYRQSKILNFHNLHGNYFSIFALPLLSRRKKVIWTLHDTWAITGRSATLDAECKKDCFKKKRCEHLDIYPTMYKNRTRFFKRAKKLIYKFSKLTIVCPSEWLAGEVKKSKMFPEKTQIITVHNGIDLSRFGGEMRNDARKKLSLPLDKKIIFFQAGWINDPRKGIIDALKTFSISNPQDVYVVIMGYYAQDVESLLPQNLGGFKLLSYVDNIAVPSYFSAADILAFPSWYENLSTTMIESLASGTPVVAFDTGGNKEIVNHLKNGYIAKHKDYTDFWEGVDYVLNEADRKSFCEDARKKAETEFSLDKFINNYLLLINYQNE
jgi:glycosyltransferase involved in cell wall biosynthesis